MQVFWYWSSARTAASLHVWSLQLMFYSWLKMKQSLFPKMQNLMVKWIHFPVIGWGGLPPEDCKPIKFRCFCWCFPLNNPFFFFKHMWHLKTCLLLESVNSGSNNALQVHVRLLDSSSPARRSLVEEWCSNYMFQWKYSTFRLFHSFWCRMNIQSYCPANLFIEWKD